MKDSAMINVAKNLPGVRINIKADLGWLAFMAVIGIFGYKIFEMAAIHKYAEIENKYRSCVQSNYQGKKEDEEAAE